jgi:hypothetical protein
MYPDSRAVPVIARYSTIYAILAQWLCPNADDSDFRSALTDNDTRYTATSA